MIIKRKNKPGPEDNNPNQNNADNLAPHHTQSLETSSIQGPVIRERQERRRGDRRRGYRRIDDRNLISRAQEEANAIRESAARDGFEHGVNISQEELKRLNNAINELLMAREKAMQESIPDIAVLAVKAAEKLIKKELEVDDKIVLNVVSEVIKSFGSGDSQIIIKTNPNDREIVEQSLPKIYPHGSGKTQIAVIADETVDWGSCIVETQSGVVDARFSTQLLILQQALEAGL